MIISKKKLGNQSDHHKNITRAILILLGIFIVTALLGCSTSPSQSKAEPHSYTLIKLPDDSYQPVYIGSTNFTTNSINIYRNVGTITQNSTVVNGITSTLASDFESAIPY